MKKLFALCACLTLLCACSKNEFTVEVEQAPGYSPTDISIIYYSSDPKKGWISICELPAGIGTAQKGICLTRNPSLCFVYSASRMLTVFWAERGDRMQLHCRDGFWIASGNEVTDSLAQWQALNRNIIQANATTDLNRSISQYVTAHPSRTVSAILLYVYYNAKADPEGYNRLRSLLRGDAADADITRAAGVIPYRQASDTPLPSIHLRSDADTLGVVKTTGTKATIILFWSDLRSRTDRVASLRKSLDNNTAGIRIADINMQADTLNWRQTLRADSTTGWIHLWAPGAEENTALLPYSLPRPDYIIVTDKRGKAIYRGTDTDKAVKAAIKSAS